MLFNSFDFLVFFPLVTLVYFLLPAKARTLWLLAASCYFYMAFIPAYIFILFTTITVDYFSGIFIEKFRSSSGKKIFLGASLAANVGFLTFFKFAGPASSELAALARFLHWNYPAGVLAVALPIGLSFHTLQAMAYTIEVYRGRQKAEKNFLIFSLYVMFYPQLVAGPIERPQNLLQQLRETHVPDYDRMAAGLRKMLWGFFKKLVIADRVALLVNQVFAHPADYHGLPVWLAMYFFAFQIYCDFSGYTDIAIGAAEVMGFRLMKNFDRPYLASSITDFWRRWHISLSSWFRDYLYIPLGGDRLGKARWSLNVLIVFLVSGLWHGAGWTYAVWGLYHGALLVLSRSFERTRNFLSRLVPAAALPAVKTFLVFQLVSFGWIFFRARSLSDAALMFRRLFSGLGGQLRHPLTLAWHGEMMGSFYMGLDGYELAVSFIAIAALFFFYRFPSFLYYKSSFDRRPLWQRWGAYYLLIGAVILFGMDRSERFIYFQF